MKKGFTLAETLITLVIIGVVAALTVPTLIVKYQKEQTVTRLKKAYSTLAQTTQKAVADNGPINTWEVGEVNNAEDAKTFFNKYIGPYVNLSKNVKTQSDGGFSVGNIYYLNNYNFVYSNAYCNVYLLDGTRVDFHIQYSDSTNKRIDFNIDINGDKKPNKLGKDIFQYAYYVLNPNNTYNGKFLPVGSGSSRNTILTTNSDSACNSNKGGWWCAALIMKDGWQIKDDYPW